MDIWCELGIEPTGDKRTIRRAYATRLKAAHPEDDPDGFQRLRAAYEEALALVEHEDGGIPVLVTRARAEADADSLGTPPNEAANKTEDWTAFDALLASVTIPLKKGQAGPAEAALEAALRAPLLVNIELRRLFETRLLARLAEYWPLPDSFAAAAVEAFRWDEDLRHLPPEYQFLARELIAVPEGRQRVAELRGLARRWLPRYVFDKKPLAAALLTGPFRPWLFMLAALNLDIHRAVAGLLSELRAFYPEVLASELEPRTVAHWLRVIDAPPGRAAAALHWVYAHRFAALTVLGTPLGIALGLAGMDRMNSIWVIGITLAGLMLLLDLGPALLGEWLQVLALPPRTKRILWAGLAIGAVSIGFRLENAYGDAALGVSFICIMALTDERDLLAYIRGVIIVWLGLGLLMRLGVLPELPLKALFLAAQVFVFAGLKTRRLLETGKGDTPETR